MFLYVRSLFKSTLLYRVSKIMFTAIAIQFILYLYQEATFQSPEGGRSIEVGLYNSQ